VARFRGAQFPGSVNGPTTERLLDPDAVPYFLWDVGVTVAGLRARLAGGGAERDEMLVRLLREANSRDVWLFVDWKDIEEAWPRIEHRLGRARAVWRLMLERRRQNFTAARGR
jgi:hypothetical protein